MELEGWEAGLGAWPVLEEVEQEEVRPRRGEGGVNPADGCSSAGEGDKDLEREKERDASTIESCYIKL